MLSRWRSRAYPRRCGEHPIILKGLRDYLGLPPQVRGAPSVSTRAVAARWAYPRRCGEHSIPMKVVRSCEGLPPQVRGARRVGDVAAATVGLTPAGAGSTSAIR